MSDSGIKPRLVIIVFMLACASVILSTVLLVSQFLAPRVASIQVTKAADPLIPVENAIADRDWSSAWSRLIEAAGSRDLALNQRGIALVWELWQADPRGPSLIEMAGKRFSLAPAFDERVLLCYLLLQAGQGKTAASLSIPGEFKDKFPALDAELAMERHPGFPVRFSALMQVGREDDTRLALDRAFSLGFLGDHGEALVEADRVVRLTDPPGVNGTGMIDVSRGLCRRQIARTIQIMGLWDSQDRSSTALMKTAATELLFDPSGYVRVAPDYFGLLFDALAWTGMKEALIGLYQVAEESHYVLDDARQETRALIGARPEMRPATWRDLRAVLARPASSDTRAAIVDIQEAAWSHNDERSFRLLAWYLWKTANTKGLRALLEKNRINRGQWYDLYAGLLDEKAGLPEQAMESLVAATSGSQESTALLNQARLRLSAGQVEKSASLIDESLALIRLRSLGLQDVPGTAYADLHADAMALRARLFDIQGRKKDAEHLLKRIHELDPKHPALYQATGIAVSPETGMEQTRDSVEE